MTTLTDVITTLKEINQSQEESSAKRGEDLKVVFEQGFKDLVTAVEKSRGIRLPGLPSISDMIFNNPIANAISSIKDGIMSVVTAPYRLLMGAVDSITSTFSKIGSILMSPINMIKSLLFSNKSEGGIESLEILKEINNGIKDLNSTLVDYIEMLKADRLDQLESDIESRRDRANPPPPPSPGDDPSSDRGGGFTFLGIPGLKFLGALSVAATAEILGLDDFIKGLLLPDTFKKIKNTIGKVSRWFDSVIEAFSKIKLPDLPKIGITEKLARFGGLIKSFFGNLRLPDLPDLPRLNFSLPSLPQIKFPDVSKFLDPVKSFLSGFQDFLSPTFDAFKTLLGPLKSVSKVLKGVPIVGQILTVFDGLFGAIKGFFSTEGTIGDKLLGALEGAVMGIITGITDAIDLFIVKIPAFFLEKLGFEGAAEKLRGFSVTQLVVDLWEGVKGLFSGGIEGLTNTLKNIPDYLYLAAQKYLRISIPEISIGLPDWLGGGKFTLIPEFSVGFGSDEGAREAQQNITRRNEELIQRRRTLEEESNRILERSQDRLSEAEDRVNNSRVAAVSQNNIDARRTQNNVSVMNQGAFPLPVDVRDPVRMPI